MKTLSILAPCLITAIGAASASAQVLLLNFGVAGAPTDVVNNSPYHTANTGFADTYWNTIGTADVASGLFLSNGTTSSGASINLGTSTTSTINLATNPGTASALGTASSGGIYLNNTVAKSGVFSGSSSSNNSVGVQIGGLAVGTYDIYITARNTNTGQQAGNGYTQTIYAGVGSSGNFDYSSYSANSASLVYASNQATNYRTDSWIEGENYVKLSVSITTLGEYLNVAVDGTNSGGTGDTRGFLNSIQIVNTSQIPEPSAFAALAGLGVLGLAACRRRRSVA